MISLETGKKVKSTRVSFSIADDWATEGLYQVQSEKMLLTCNFFRTKRQQEEEHSRPTLMYHGRKTLGREKART